MNIVREVPGATVTYVIPDAPEPSGRSVDAGPSEATHTAAWWHAKAKEMMRLARGYMDQLRAAVPGTAAAAEWEGKARRCMDTAETCELAAQRGAPGPTVRRPDRAPTSSGMKIPLSWFAPQAVPLAAGDRAARAIVDAAAVLVKEIRRGAAPKGPGLETLIARKSGWRKT